MTQFINYAPSFEKYNYEYTDFGLPPIFYDCNTFLLSYLLEHHLTEKLQNHMPNLAQLF